MVLSSNTPTGEGIRPPRDPPALLTLAILGAISVFLEEGLLIIVTDCMIFLSPVLDAIRMAMSTVSSLS